MVHHQQQRTVLPCPSSNLEHCPNHHVLLVVVEIIDHGFSLLKHFSNAVGHGLVNVTLTAVKDFLKQDLSNLEIAVQPKVSRGEIRAVGRPIISSPGNGKLRLQLMSPVQKKYTKFILRRSGAWSPSEDDPTGARVVFARPWGGAVLKLSV